MRTGFSVRRYKVSLMCDPNPLPLKTLCSDDLQTNLDIVT